MSHAASSLTAAMKAAGLSQDKLAAELGVAGPSVWAWTKGRSKPRAKFRLALHKRFGIDPADWDEDTTSAVPDTLAADVTAALEAE